MSSKPYQRPLPPGVLAKPSAAHRLQPSNHQISDYVRSHPDYYRDHPTARRPSPPVPDGPDVIWKSYFPPHISLAVLPGEGTPKRYIFTDREYTIKQGARLDQHGIPIVEPQPTSEVSKSNGRPVRARPWKPMCISIARQGLNPPTVESSSRVHPSQYREALVASPSARPIQHAPILAASSVNSGDEITLVASASFAPDEERPKRTRFVPASVHPDLRGRPGAASAVYCTNYDLETGNDPFNHGKSYWGGPLLVLQDPLL